MSIDYQKEASEMEKYISELKEMYDSDPDFARNDAIKSLISSGLLNTDGVQKEEICNRY